MQLQYLYCECVAKDAFWLEHAVLNYIKQQVHNVAECRQQTAVKIHWCIKLILVQYSATE